MALLSMYTLPPTGDSLLVKLAFTMECVPPRRASAPAALPAVLPVTVRLVVKEVPSLMELREGGGVGHTRWLWHHL